MPSLLNDYNNHLIISNLKFMKILVTGCAGFIGYHICLRLLKEKKYSIVGIDNLNSYYSPRLKNKRLKLFYSPNQFTQKKIALLIVN